MTTTNVYRLRGRPAKYTFYNLKPGESCTVIANPNGIYCAVNHLRRSRGWNLTARKTGFGIEVRRWS